MKKIKITIILLLLTVAINAQSPIIDIEEYSFRNSVENAYYKDIHNYFDPFMGTWLYTNGSESFKIVLTKELMLYTGKFYTDYITGEYHYTDGGSIDVNTLSNTDPYKHGIHGSFLINNNGRPVCNDCVPGEKRLLLTISDRERHLGGSFILQLITVNGQPAIKGFIYGYGAPAYEQSNPPPYTEMQIPTGTFIFIKQ